MRAAVDVTPLLGTRAGIGVLVDGMVGALRARPDVEVVPFALTWRGRGCAGAVHRPIPARLVQQLWRRVELFPVTTWVGAVDVVHGTNYVVGPHSPLRRTPRIVTVHDLAPVRTPELCDPATLVFPSLVRRAVRSGAFVQTDSEAVAVEVRDWLGLESTQVRAIHPGLTPLEVPDPEGLDLRLAGRPFVLTLGKEDPRKGLDVMAEAFDHLHTDHPDMVWVHAGSSAWGTGALDGAIAHMRPSARERAVRLGRVTAAQKAWLLCTAAVFAFPSIDEGFGFPPLEALSVGTPVVCSDLPVLREVVGPAAAFVGVSNAQGLASALADALDAGAVTLRADRVAHASSFRWDKSAEAQVRWYRDVIEASK